MICSPQGEAWEVEAVSQAEVRARCVHVYSFGALLYTQCMTDQPVGFRRLMCGTRAAQSGSLEAVRLSPPTYRPHPSPPKRSCMY